MEKRGITVDDAQKEVAEDMATQSRNSPTMKNKLLSWAQSLADATVSDVVKETVKIAVRSVGIPIP
ncbi:MULTISPECIES: hypothetical protein [unclassified Microcoleus]|uniref:hypothetical protein n=1 Tax=unclassified Microcoleus TaxID=2642155 RepID=UPI0025D1C2C6|nr:MULTISPECIES: hypothetical protein [unclassified Microcoleus]